MHFRSSEGPLHRSTANADGEEAGGGRVKGELEPEVVGSDDAEMEQADYLALKEALDALERESPRQAKVMLLRHYGGMTQTEVSEILQVTTRTIKSDEAAARDFLSRHLGG